MENKKTSISYFEKFGLSHDPFGTPVAEQELKRVGDIFYKYFTPPHAGASHKDLDLQILRKRQNGFIFGSPGSGKSTLRLALEADCRTVLDGTLTITYDLGEDFKESLSQDEHAWRLSRALAIDLLIQVIEQFNPSNPFPDAEQIQALQGLIQQGGGRVRRLIRRLLEHKQVVEEANTATTNLSIYWPMLGKVPVRYVPASKELFKLLELLLPEAQIAPTPGWNNFWSGLKVAQMWGFQQTFILVDGVDARDRSPKTMFSLISPLLAILPYAQHHELFFKFFLPSELEKVVQESIGRLSSLLLSESFFSIMNWDKKTLQQILAQRFRSAGIRSTGLDALAEAGLDLDTKVIEASKGSPRLMLQIVHALFQTHMIYNPDTPILRRQDWEETSVKWEAKRV
jgi:hypothetical protein